MHPKSSRPSAHSLYASRTNRVQETNAPEVVSGRWLVKAMLATLVAAGIALYCTVCLLFYQGQWQFVFSPHAASRVATLDSQAASWARRKGPTKQIAPPSAALVAATSGLPIHDLKFDYTEEGVARLDGWWIPAMAPDSALSTIVVLFCPDGRSTLPSNVTALQAFHTLGVSVFAFDYRGFGESQKGHPSQRKAYEDGQAALQYLTSTRHIDPKRIAIYGAAAAGAAVAAQVASRSPQVGGLILEDPQLSLVKQVKREEHIHVLPMWLIFTDRFDISHVLPTLRMPKLILSTARVPEYKEGAAAVYEQASAPKEQMHVDSRSTDALYAQPTWKNAVHGFLTELATRSN